MLQLNNVKKLVKKTKRIGRGGSRGGTSGKGNKGQKARSGGAVRPGFEGGQMPLFRRLPKRGFTNAIFKSEIEIISLAHLDMFDNGTQVDKALLIEHGIIKSKISRRGSDLQLKVLGNGALSKKLIVVVDACSQSAKEAIEKLGGEVRLIKEM